MRYIGIRKVVLLYSQSLSTIQFRLSMYHLLALEEEAAVNISECATTPFYFFGLLPRPKGHRRAQKKTARYDDDKKNIKGLTRAGRNFIEQFLCSIAAIATLSGHAWWTVCSMTSSLKTMPTMLMTNEGTKTSAMSMNP